MCSLPKMKRYYIFKEIVVTPSMKLNMFYDAATYIFRLTRCYIMYNIYVSESIIFIHNIYVSSHLSNNNGGEELIHFLCSGNSFNKYTYTLKARIWHRCIYWVLQISICLLFDKSVSGEWSRQECYITLSPSAAIMTRSYTVTSSAEHLYYTGSGNRCRRYNRGTVSASVCILIACNNETHTVYV